MMHSRIGRASAILLAIAAFGGAMYAAMVCFRRSQMLYGGVIILSFTVMLVCTLFLAVKSILDGEQIAYAKRGEEKGRVACGCSYRDFESSGGELVCYEKGLAYERDGEEPLGILPYGRFSHAMQDGNAVMVFVAFSVKARVLTVETRSELKARAVLGMLEANGIEIRR